MPGLTGESQTGFEYAGHMYILKPSGDPNVEDDHVFVGGAELRVSDYETGLQFHLGVSTIEEQGEAGIWCEKSEGLFGQRVGLRPDEIPAEVKAAGIRKGLRRISTLDGQILLQGLGIGFPEDLTPRDWHRWVNGSPEEQAEEDNDRRQYLKIRFADIHVAGGSDLKALLAGVRQEIA